MSSFRLSTGGGGAASAAGGPFGLSPRTSAAVRPLASQSHPRADPSPKMPASFHNGGVSQATHAFPPPAAAKSVGGVSIHSYDSHAKRRHDLPSDVARNRSNSFDHSDDDDDSESESESNDTNTHSSHRGGAGHSRRDRESEELALWKQQQQMLEAQTRNYNLIKYGMVATIVLLLLVFVFLIGQQSGGPTAPLRPASQFYQSSSFDSLDDIPVDLESARRVLTEMTQRETERERRALFEVEASGQPREVGPVDEAIAKLDPVSRATAVVPQPGGFEAHVSGVLDHERGHEYAKDHAASSMGSQRAGRLDDLETPDLLRRLAQTQRLAQLENERGALGAVGGRRNPRAARAGGSDEDALDAPIAAPLHPTPSQVSHVVIEKLIHENTPEGATARPHSHKDHPNVPKFGNGTPVIPMPVDPKAPKQKAAAPPTPAPAAAAAPVAAAPAPVEAVPAPAAPTPAIPAAPVAPAAAETKASADTKPVGESKVAESPKSTATPPQVDTSSAPKAASSASADATENVDLDAPASGAPSAGGDDEDLLSELSHASRPTEVSAVADEAAGKLNKKTGLKGPVLRGANAEAQHEDKTEEEAEAEQADKDEDDEAAPKSATVRASGGVQDGEFLKAAAAAWLSHKGQTLADTVHWALPAEGVKDKYLFDDDVQVIVLTTRKNQALARKMKDLFSPFIRRLSFVSDARDRGLNATVLVNPHPEWSVAEGAKESPWRLYKLFKRLADPKRSPNPPKFYFLLRDTTFPLLDQIAWKLRNYRQTYKGAYPNFVAGRKSEHKFESTYWKEQQEQGAKMFGRRKLFTAPAFMVGFDHEFVRVVSESASARACPVLPTEALALAGLVECAGGAFDHTEFDFLAQARSNHREKKIDPVASPLSQWRNFDAFNGCNTPGILQEAFDAYYGKLKE